MISIIVPIYNASKTINRCLDSLIHQTIFDKMEIILINDGSTDGTEDILLEYRNKYPNIYFETIANSGVSAARNRGLSIAKGSYIGFMDADDYIDSDYYELLLNNLKKGYDLVCCGFIAEYEDGRYVKKSSREERTLDQKESIIEFLMGKAIGPGVWNKLYRREILGGILFDASIKIAEDKYFVFQSLKRSKKIMIIPCAGYHYVMNDQSAMHDTFSEKQFHSFEVMRRISDEVAQEYPQYTDMAQSAKIDVECRVCGEMCHFNVVKQYEEIYKSLRRDIRHYSILKKARYSNKKHFLAFLMAKMNPHLYTFVKKKMRFEFK